MQFFSHKSEIVAVCTGRSSSKYEHRRASALLRNISIKNSLPYLKCVLRLSCMCGPRADLWPFSWFLSSSETQGQIVGAREV